MSASGPVQEPKMFPAATMEDQEAAMEGNPDNVIVLGGAPFSSPDPETIAKTMLPLSDGTSAYEAREDVVRDEDGAQVEGTNYDSMSPAELKTLAEERDLSVTGTGANGNVLKKDLVAALKEDDTSDMKAADFKTQIEAATTQEELDAAAELYADSGKNYSTVVTAVEKKQTEINEANEADSGDGNDS